LTKTGHQTAVKETTVAKETTAATTFGDNKTLIAIKTIAPRTTSKEMLQLLGIPQACASSVEKWDTLPETA